MRGISFFLNLDPKTAPFKIAAETFLGFDLLTGEKLTLVDRAVGGAAVFAGGAKNVGNFGKKFIPGPILKGAGKVGEKVGKYAIRPAKLAAGWIKERTYRGARRISGDFWRMFGCEVQKLVEIRY